MCAPPPRGRACQPALTADLFCVFLLVPGLVSKLTELFHAKHGVASRTRAERAQEHRQRLRDANATDEEVQAVLMMCEKQATMVEHAKKALVAGFTADPETQSELFVRAAQIACLALAPSKHALLAT